MGEPVRVAELAKTSGSPLRQTAPEFEFIGLRPGEKLFEELFYPDERILPSACAKIACTESVRLAWPALKSALDGLYIAMSLGERDSILAHLRQIVPQFTYAGSDENVSGEKAPSRVSPDVCREASLHVDMSASPDLPWHANAQTIPFWGPVRGSAE